MKKCTTGVSNHTIKKHTVKQKDHPELPCDQRSSMSTSMSVLSALHRRKYLLQISQKAGVSHLALLKHATM